MAISPKSAKDSRGLVKLTKTGMIIDFLKWTLLLLLPAHGIHAQADSSPQGLFNQIYLAAEKEYGIPQELINGLLFEAKHEGARGHPYFLEYYSNQGSVIYRGKRYSNLNLRYDLYDQQLLLIYVIDHVEHKVYLQKEFITGFTVENKPFIKESFAADEEAKFYQVFGEDLPTKVLYFWKKGLSKLYANNSDKKMFSEQRETYLLIENELLSFTGNRSFVRKFSPERTKAIKQYLRLTKTKVNLADDEAMERLLKFINSSGNQ